MLIRDIVGLPLSAMWQQKVRLILTTLGVLFGAFVLSASLSIGQGVQDIMANMARRTDLLRKVHVSPNWETLPPPSNAKVAKAEGTFDEKRQERLANVLKEISMQSVGKRVLHKLDKETIAKLSELEKVDTVLPIVRMGALVELNKQSQMVEIGSTGLDNPDLSKRLVSGRFFESNQEMGLLISEFLLYRLGIRDEKAFDEILGKTIRLEFRRNNKPAGFGFTFVKGDGTGPNPVEALVLEKIKRQIPNLIPKMDLSGEEKKTLLMATAQINQLPPALVTIQIPVVGIFRLKSPEEMKAPWNPLEMDNELFLSSGYAKDLFFQVNPNNDQGLQEITLVADRQESVKGLVETIGKMGLRPTGLLDHIERERMLYLMIFGGMTCVAAVAMIVAALGITNTMFMSVLERTREIGIMKAVGASNNQMLSIFLIEGTLIGLAGGICGLLLTWVASFPGDAWIRSMVFRELKVNLKETLFVFPIWLLIVVPLFSMVVTTLAALGPARRAANIDPVMALRHE